MAKLLFEKSLKINILSLGKNHDTVAINLSNYANVLKALGDLQNA